MPEIITIDDGKYVTFQSTCHPEADVQATWFDDDPHLTLWCPVCGFRSWLVVRDEDGIDK